MARSTVRAWPVMFAVAASLVTGVATWAVYRATHSTLGTVGAVLTALAAAMIVGAPLYIATAIIWMRDPKGSSQRPASGVRRRSGLADEEESDG